MVVTRGKSKATPNDMKYDLARRDIPGLQSFIKMNWYKKQMKVDLKQSIN